MAKTWFITGTSRGFGREWTEAALKRGDKVAATVRDLRALDDLVDQYEAAIMPIQLDVTDAAADQAAIDAAFEYFGTIDIIVNNAGYGLFGTIEEVSEQEAREQIETNLFGPLWITKAALPYLRNQGHGHILQVSSIGGIGAFAGLGMYHASKWGLEGFSDALSKEVKDFNINVTIIEPGGFETDWAGDSSKHATPIEAYNQVRDGRPSGNKRGDPKATSDVVLKLVDSPAPPLRLLLGKAATQIIPPIYEDRLRIWKEWEDDSIAADGR